MITLASHGENEMLNLYPNYTKDTQELESKKQWYLAYTFHVVLLLVPEYGHLEKDDIHDEKRYI
jgi:hypothetical protein